MTISLIVAVDNKNGIGKDNELLWKLPNDMKHFKDTTSGHVVIMGRKTFESIGKPLPNRANVVLTRDSEYMYDHEDVYIYTSFADLLYETEVHGFDQEIFVIGGAEIYKLFLQYADKVYVTKVDGEFDADAFFPSLYSDEWEVESEVHYSKDDNNKYDHVISLYTR